MLNPWDVMQLPKSSRHYEVHWETPITLPCLTERLHEEGLGPDVLKDILEHRDEELVEELCGPRYDPDPKSSYRRAGTRTRTLGTRFGKITIKITRVKNTTTGRWITPLFQDVKIQAYKIYQEDVVHKACSMAQRMSYRNTREELEHFVNEAPSPMTINRRLIEHGQALSNQIHERELTAATHQLDGTKLHAQGRHNHLTDVHLGLATTSNGGKRLRSLTVGHSWHAHRSILDRTTFENEDGEPVPPSVVTDLERGLHDLVTPEDGYWQPCLVHVIKNTRYRLWEDGLSQGEEKKRYIQTLSKVLAHLRNSLNKHLPEDNEDRIRHRIKQTTKELRRLGTRLLNRGYQKAGSFLHRVSEQVVTFATLALEGIHVPWHNNVVERLMGEVSKRCKHKWMTWTTHGGQALLTLLVVRTVEPGTHDAFWDEKLYGQAAGLRDRGVRVTRLGVAS